MFLIIVTIMMVFTLMSSCHVSTTESVSVFVCTHVTCESLVLFTSSVYLGFCITLLLAVLLVSCSTSFSFLPLFASFIFTEALSSLLRS